MHLKAHVAAGLGLLAALVVAVFAYSMPAEMAGKAAVLGGLTGAAADRLDRPYATLGHIDNAGALALSVSAGAPGSSPLPGTGQIGLATGLRHSF